MENTLKYVRKMTPSEYNIFHLLLSDYFRAFAHFHDIINEVEVRLYDNPNSPEDIYTDGNLNVVCYFAQESDKNTGKITEEFIVLDKRLLRRELKKELAFAYMHELLHKRFEHIKRFKYYFDKNGPLTNFALNLFINSFVIQHITNVDERFLSSTGIIELLDRNRTEMFINEKVNVPPLSLQEIEFLKKASDVEIIELFFKKFEEFFQELTPLIDQAIEEELENILGQTNSNQNSTENNNGQDNNQNNDGQNTEIDIRQLVQNILDNLQQKSKKKESEDQNYANKKKELLKYGSPNDAIVDYIMQKLFGKGEGDNDENSEDKEKYHMQKLEEFAKSKGTNYSFQRTLVQYTEKFTIPQIIQRHLNYLQKGGVIKRKLYYPNKKYQNHDVIMPYKKYLSGNMTIIVDTSGSMSEEELKVLSAFAYYLLREGFTLNVYFNDTEYEFYKVDSISKWKNILQKNIVGGGGSVFTEVFRKVSKDNEFGFVFSDLYIDGHEHLTPKFLVIVPRDYDRNVANTLQSRGINVISIDNIKAM